MKKSLFIIFLIFCPSLIHATWTDFYMVTSGSDTSSGSTSDAVAPVATTNGSWAQGVNTARFIAASGTPFASTTVGQWASICYDTSTCAVFIASVTNVVSNTTIDVDTITFKYGIVPIAKSTARTCKIGGAWQSLTIGTAGNAFGQGTLPLSTRVNIQAGTYAIAGVSKSIGIVGTTLLPLWFRGYKNTPGDEEGNFNPNFGTDIPQITSSGGRFITATNGFDIVSNLSFLGNLNNTVVAANSLSILYQCFIENQNAGASAGAVTTQSNVKILQTWMKCDGTAGSCISATSASQNHFLGNMIIGGSNGINTSSNGNFDVEGNIFVSQNGDGIVWSQDTGWVKNNTFYGQTGNGINLTSLNTNNSQIENNYCENITGASKACINNTSGANTFYVTLAGNSFYNCTSGYSGFTENFYVSDIGQLNQSGLRNASGNDFTPNSNIWNSAIPTSFPNTNVFKSYLAVGGVQNQNPGGAYSVSQ